MPNIWGFISRLGSSSDYVALRVNTEIVNFFPGPESGLGHECGRLDSTEKLMSSGGPYEMASQASLRALVQQLNLQLYAGEHFYAHMPKQRMKLLPNYLQLWYQ